MIHLIYFKYSEFKVYTALRAFNVHGFVHMPGFVLRFDDQFIIYNVTCKYSYTSFLSNNLRMDSQVVLGVANVHVDAVLL